MCLICLYNYNYMEFNKYINELNSLKIYLFCMFHTFEINIQNSSIYVFDMIYILL